MAPSLPSLRLATPDDAEPLLRLWAQAAHGRSVSDDLVPVMGFLGHPSSRCVVAEVDGVLVGSVLMGWDGWRLSVYRLAVDPSVRRQGVAGRLLDEVERLAVDVGARRIDAMVAVANEDGAAFWHAAGFEPNPRYVRFERRMRSTP